jgi:hypothetical protein
MPIYFYRLLDGSVNSVTDAAGYSHFLTCFREGLLQKDDFDAVHLDRVLSFEILLFLNVERPFIPMS